MNFCSIWRFWCVRNVSVVLKNDHGGCMKMTLLVFALLFVGSLAGCSGKHVCKDRITNNTAVYFFGMCSGAWFSLGMRLISTPLVVASPSKSAFFLPVSSNPFDIGPKLQSSWSSGPAIPSPSFTIFKKSFLSSCFQNFRRQSYLLPLETLCVLAFCVWCRSPITFWNNQLSLITLKMICCWQASQSVSRWETYTMK